MASLLGMANVPTVTTIIWYIIIDDFLPKALLTLGTDPDFGGSLLEYIQFHLHPSHARPLQGSGSGVHS